MRMPGSMCLEVFVQGRLDQVLEMVSVEDHIQEVVVLDVLAPVCVYVNSIYIHFC